MKTLYKSTVLTDDGAWVEATDSSVWPITIEHERETILALTIEESRAIRRALMSAERAWAREQVAR